MTIRVRATLSDDSVPTGISGARFAILRSGSARNTALERSANAVSAIRSRRARAGLLLPLSVLCLSVHGQEYEPDADEELIMEEVVVTGSRIKRRDYTSPSPLTTVGRDDLEFSGQPTLEEIPKQRLG